MLSKHPTPKLQPQLLFINFEEAPYCFPQSLNKSTFLSTVCVTSFSPHPCQRLQTPVAIILDRRKCSRVWS